MGERAPVNESGVIALTSLTGGLVTHRKRLHSSVITKKRHVERDVGFLLRNGRAARRWRPRNQFTDGPPVRRPAGQCHGRGPGELFAR